MNGPISLLSIDRITASTSGGEAAPLLPSTLKASPYLADRCGTHVTRHQITSFQLLRLGSFSPSSMNRGKWKIAGPGVSWWINTIVDEIVAPMTIGEYPLGLGQ